MIPRSVVDIDAQDALPETLAEFRYFIDSSAHLIARDNMLAQDLAQEAAILLWELDPTRFDAKDADYLRSAMYQRMLFAARTERRARGDGRRVEFG